VIELRFAAEDLLRVRFATSQLQELLGALRSLNDPAAHALHLPWIARAGPAVEDLDLAPLLDLLGDPYTPDFLSPAPRTPLGTLDEELELLQAVAPAVIRRELDWLFEDRPRPPIARDLVDDPAAALRRLAGLLRELWERLLAADWPHLRALLEGDVLYRARRLTENGIAGLLDDIHPLVRVSGGVIRVAKEHDEVADLAGRGLLLVPSAFAWPEVLVTYDEPHQPAIVYPPRGIGLLWAACEPAEAPALAGVIGRSRARILADLDAPRSTSELARRLAASAGGVSTHLGALRSAGLVAAHRHGRVVLYARTDAGQALMAAAGEP
jgi:DNA-binding transcriptional ArsR family regulator